MCLPLSSLVFYFATARTFISANKLSLFNVKHLIFFDHPFMKSTLAQGFTLVLYSRRYALKLNYIDHTTTLGTRQSNATLALIFATTITIRCFAHFIRFKKEHLRHALVSINLCGKWSCVRKL